MKIDCCDKMTFQRLTEGPSDLADPGTAEGVEFTVGSCVNCKHLLMHCWVGGGMSQGYETIEQAFVDKLSAEKDAQKRKRLLAVWWNAL